MPSISVIIPAYNSATCIGGAIESVLNQTFRDTEVIVVDDGSTDETGSIVKSFPGVRYIRQVNQGASAARNTGIMAAEGEYIAFLDADDRWFENKLSLQRAIFAKYPDICWVAGSNVRVMQDRTFCESAAVAPIPNSEDRVDALPALVHGGGEGFHTDAIIVRKSTLDEIGHFDPDLSSGEDLDLWVRLALRHPVVGYVREPVAEYINTDHLSLSRRFDAKRLRSAHLLAGKLTELARGHNETTNLLLRQFAFRLVLSDARELLHHGKNRESRSLLKFCREQSLGNIPLSITLLNSIPPGMLMLLKRLRRMYRYIEKKADCGH